jgi:putative pyoverdin transport system ATP-binding/permease protein
LSYTQLLPELKARRKTVLVITRDDKYFHLADRLINLDDGKIEHGRTDRFETIAGRLRRLTTV